MGSLPGARESFSFTGAETGLARIETNPQIDEPISGAARFPSPPERPRLQRIDGTSSPQCVPPLGHGTVVNDRYEIRQSLGKGGMGEVFLAYDRSTQQPVALKIVREESRMPGDDEALRQELLLARSVSHPNVCRVHDLAPSPWGPILVMEHIAGQTLHTHIRRKKAQGGYTADEFRKIASEACAGLAAIHAQGLVHGDLKPGNVMVTERPRGIILDFGFAQERARSQRAAPGRAARRRHAELHGAGALALRRREPRGRHLRARPHALGDVDLPRARARLPAAREADARADHVRRACRL